MAPDALEPAACAQEASPYQLEPLVITWFRGATVPTALLSQLLHLVETNMRRFGPTDTRRLLRQTTHPRQHLLLYLRGGSICAAASCRVCHEQRARVVYLYELQVVEAYRRRKIGAALLQQVEQFGRDEGAMGAMLTVNLANHAAIRFYSGCGFAVSPISPSACDPSRSECEYEIMQKVWDDATARELERRGERARKWLART
ncbi:hypothetical protein AB1Y20_002026 [Prymnesium parvum]|uniref:N-alpha-acetyltransferase 40 n=1 Tax=Prymnesium parvum TaxID=97485 RepID=A0AB34J7P6_PRYPA